MHTHRTITFDVERFIMLDAITDCTATVLTAEKHFANAPAYLALEAMAQTGGMHFRHCMKFSRHAFLLSIQDTSVLPSMPLSGLAKTTVTQTAQTDSTAAYTIQFSCADVLIEGAFLFGCTDYGAQFSQSALTTHYRELFQCLQNA